MKANLGKKFFWDLGCGGFLCLLIFANLASWQSASVGIILLLIYFYTLADKWRLIFAKVYSLEKKLIELKVISWLWVVALVSLFSSIAIVFYSLTDNTIINILFLAWITTIFFEAILRSVVAVVINEVPEEEKLVVFTRPFWILPFGFFVLIIACAVFLFSVKLGAVSAFSPWQFINTRFLVWFFFACFLVGLSVFARYRTRIVLTMIIMLSLLQHLYIPMSHQLPWGGDVWRLMAVESSLEQGGSVSPVLFGTDKIEKGKIFGVEIPRVFLVPQKYTYGSLCGLSVILAKTLNLSLLSINRWLLPILFSIAIPVLLFRIGFLLFQSRRRGLLLAWLSLLPFPLQVWGGMTLSVSLGYLFFFLALWLWMEYWQDMRPLAKFFTVSFSLLLLFGYALHFILIWSLVILRALWLWFGERKNMVVKNTSRVILVIASLCVIPVVELASGYSRISLQLDWWKNIKQLVGQFSGWFYASMIRPHDIVNGNLFFNHTPARAFVDNLFLHRRWWLIPAMLLLWLISFVGLFPRRDDEKKSWPIVWILYAITFGGYVISWYFLDGDHLFARRLDLLLPVLTLVLFIAGIERFLIKLHNNEGVLRWIICGIVLCVSFFITATYASGPDVRAVGVQNEFNVAQYIWRSRDDAGGSRCVLADTWTLLPLEYFSAGQIVGGGFPMDYNFGQTSRVALFEKFFTNPEAQDMKEMKKLTGTNQCWFAQSADKLSQSVIDKITSLVGTEPRQVNGVLLWLTH